MVDIFIIISEVFLQRIGLFGGTFNPVHAGHLYAIEAVRKRFPLNRVVLIPSALPPHKRSDNLVDTEDRLEMLRLACEGYPELALSDVELNRVGPSYTIDTIQYFKKKATTDTELLLIVGIDAFLEINTWKECRRLFELIPFVVMPRPILYLGQPDLDLEKHLEPYLKQVISSRYYFSVEKHQFIHPTLKPVNVVSFDPLAVSSTEIRRRIRQNLTIQGLVPETVRRYIKNKGLYL